MYFNKVSNWWFVFLSVILSLSFSLHQQITAEGHSSIQIFQSFNVTTVTLKQEQQGDVVAVKYVTARREVAHKLVKYTWDFVGGARDSSRKHASALAFITVRNKNIDYWLSVAREDFVTTVINISRLPRHWLAMLAPRIRWPITHIMSRRSQ